MKLRGSLLAFASVLMINQGMAQEESVEKKPSLEGGTLKSQYEYLIEESNDYQEYKVIRKSWTSKFGKSLNDSLKAIEDARMQAKAQSKSQLEEIAALKGQLASTKDSLVEVNAEKDNMTLVGVPIEKSGYKTTMWSIIGVLVLLLAVFIFRFRNSNVVASKAKETLNDVEEEFAEYKKRSLEREQKLRRELQDEINKQRGV